MNKNHEKHAGGRPVKFSNVKHLETMIEEYFKSCDNRTQEIFSQKSDSVITVKNPAPYTMSGLAYFLGVDRQTILNYSQKDEFFGTIKSARERVHNDVETRLMEKNATGAIFNLKNNFGWVDELKTDNKHTYPSGMKIEFVEPDADQS